MFLTVNEKWGSWSSWTSCSASCDSGFKTRKRLCNDPVPSSSDSYCNGKPFEVLKCNTSRCIGMCALMLVIYGKLIYHL